MTDLELMEMAIRRAVAQDHYKLGRPAPEHELLIAIADALAGFRDPIRDGLYRQRGWMPPE